MLSGDAMPPGRTEPSCGHCVGIGETDRVLDLWIALAGPAGAGKSSLSQAAGAALRQAGMTVDVCGEEELFTRPEFDRAARQFRGQSAPAPEDLEAAYATWVASLPEQSVAVTDWSPAGMAGDLAWAVDEQPRFRRHLQAVRGLVAHAIVVNLQAPVEVAVNRAAAGRGERWLARSDLVARAAGHRQRDRLARVHASAQAHTIRTAAELRVAASAGWVVENIDASGSPQETLSHALDALTSVRRREA